MAWYEIYLYNNYFLDRSLKSTDYSAYDLASKFQNERRKKVKKYF